MGMPRGQADRSRGRRGGGARRPGHRINEDVIVSYIYYRWLYLLSLSKLSVFCCIFRVNFFCFRI